MYSTNTKKKELQTQRTFGNLNKLFGRIILKFAVLTIIIFFFRQKKLRAHTIQPKLYVILGQRLFSVVRPYKMDRQPVGILLWNPLDTGSLIIMVNLGLCLAVYMCELMMI